MVDSRRLKSIDRLPQPDMSDIVEGLRGARAEDARAEDARAEICRHDNLGVHDELRMQVTENARLLALERMNSGWLAERVAKLEQRVERLDGQMACRAGRTTRTESNAVGSSDASRCAKPSCPHLANDDRERCHGYCCLRCRNGQKRPSHGWYCTSRVVLAAPEAAAEVVQSSQTFFEPPLETMPAAAAAGIESDESRWPTKWV